MRATPDQLRKGYIVKYGSDLIEIRSDPRKVKGPNGEFHKVTFVFVDKDHKAISSPQMLNLGNSLLEVVKRS